MEEIELLASLIVSAPASTSLSRSHRSFTSTI
jgi:hypothetical protein